MSGSENFRWTKPREDAAVLLAEDLLTDAEIGARVGVTDRQMRTWKLHPEFAARVQSLAREMGDAAKRHAISRKARRVQGYDDRRRRLLEVVEARAGDMPGVAGGPTGLLVRTVKVVGSGPAAQVVEEYAVDTGLLKELRELEKQAAVELGQWTEKREHSVNDIDAAIERELSRLTNSLPSRGSDASTAAEGGRTSPDPER